MVPNDEDGKEKIADCRHQILADHHPDATTAVIEILKVTLPEGRVWDYY
jgi:hypothetical protein